MKLLAVFLLGASRRVEFKFSLRDAEMIDEMNRILQGQ